MAELFHNLGIDAKVLAAQIINFALLLLILQKFAYKPIVRILNARKEAIKRSHEQLLEIEKRLGHAQSESDALLRAARTESEKMIADASTHAKAIADKIHADARAEAQHIITRTNASLLQEREKATQEIKKELGETIALAIEHTVGDILDERASKKMLDEALKKIPAH